VLQSRLTSIYKAIFHIYRLRRVKLIVLSEHSRKNILKKGWYNSDHIKVLTHPLNKPDRCIIAPEFCLNAAITGLIRSQKIETVSSDLKKIRAAISTPITTHVFGQNAQDFDAQKLDVFDKVTLLNRRYSEQEERYFFDKNNINALIFSKSKIYDFVVSGMVCDCVRLRCFLLLPEKDEVASELVGPIAIHNNSDLHYATKKDLFFELYTYRRRLNRKQLVSICSNE